MCFFKNYLGSNLKLHWILNFIWVIDISGWLSSLQFLSVTLPMMEIKPCLFYQVVKKLGRSRPLRIHITVSSLSYMYNTNSCLWHKYSVSDNHLWTQGLQQWMDNQTSWPRTETRWSGSTGCVRWLSQAGTQRVSNPKIK